MPARPRRFNPLPLNHGLRKKLPPAAAKGSPMTDEKKAELLRSIGWTSEPSKRWGGAVITLWNNPRGGGYTLDEALVRVGVHEGDDFAEYTTDAAPHLDVDGAVTTGDGSDGRRDVRVPLDKLADQVRRWTEAGAAFDGIAYPHRSFDNPRRRA